MMKSLKLSLLVLVFSMVLVSCATEDSEPVVSAPVTHDVEAVKVEATISKSAAGVIQYNFPAFKYAPGVTRTIPLSKADLDKSVLLAYVQLNPSNDWYPVPGNLEGVEYNIDYSNPDPNKTTLSLSRINGKADQEFGTLKIFAIPGETASNTESGIALDWWE